jgi:hypothetical protein
MFHDKKFIKNALHNINDLRLVCFVACTQKTVFPDAFPEKLSFPDKFQIEKKIRKIIDCG